jgi:hypothetical protein
VTVPRKATQSATTVVVKVTSLVNARLLPNQNPATDVVKKAMFPVNAPTKNPVRAAAADGAVVVVVAAILLVVATLAGAAKNVTSAVRLATLHATALKAAAVDMAVEEATGADTATEGEVAVARHATPAAASATCLVTVPRARNATTVRPPLLSFVRQLPTNNLQVAKLVTFLEIALLRHPVSVSATSASNLATSRLLALTRLV